MRHYVGLDVSMKKTAICIVNETGKIVHESEAATDPDILSNVIMQAGVQLELVGLESGSLSHYLIRELKKKNLPVICIDARKMSAILSVRVNKTDKNDARGIADALRAAMFTQVHEKSQEAIDRSAILTMRRSLVSQRVDTKNHIRGVLKAYGIRLGAVSSGRFSERVSYHIGPLSPMVRMMVERMLALYSLLTRQISEVDQELSKIAREDTQTKLLMTAHGVGPITALTYKAQIDDPQRFIDSRAVGAYLGMTPKQYSSGETIKQGRISKCGSTELRSLLVEAATVLLTRSKKWSKLKVWGMKLMKKKGLKKAALAVGRKLAVIMHRMLIEETEFQFGDEPKKVA